MDNEGDAADGWNGGTRSREAEPECDGQANDRARHASQSSCERGDGSQRYRQVPKRSLTPNVSIILPSREPMRQHAFGGESSRLGSRVNVDRSRPIRRHEAGRDDNESRQVRIMVKPRTSRPKERLYSRRDRSYSRERILCQHDNCSSHAMHRESRPRERRIRTPSGRFRSSSRNRYYVNTSGDETARARVRQERRRRHSSSDDDRVMSKRIRYELPPRRLLSPCSRRLTDEPLRRKKCDFNVDKNNSTQNILEKFLDILDKSKGQSSSKLSVSNVVPEFDPMVKHQTILTWLTKVEECAEIYGWNERETIHFALPKLRGVAKSWYEGLSTVLYSWTEWKNKLIESFPCREDYAELLTEMLAKRVRYGESLEQYYYAKINILNRCSIRGLKAVDCLLQGIDDRAVRVGAQAARFREPEEVLKYIKTVKPSNNKDSINIRSQEKRFTSSTNITGKRVGGDIVCYNCNTEGHKSLECSKAPSKCSCCGRLGHTDLHCTAKQANQSKYDAGVDDDKQE